MQVVASAAIGSSTAYARERAALLARSEPGLAVAVALAAAGSRA